MILSDYKNIYFLGIGGIGMSAIARWFKAQGFHVGGYDKTETSLTSQLEAEGMDIHYDNKVGRIPTAFYKKAETLVVRTPAVPKDNVELQYFEAEKYILLKRSQVLGLLTEDLMTIAVAGTHGKTTTSSMIAHILQHAGANVSAFLGGITTNYNSNLLIGKPTPKIDKMQNVPPFGKHLCVVEADEFDRSFLTLFPDIAVVTSMDADHLDIYGEHDELKKSFNQFISQIKIKGHLIVRKGLDYQVGKDKITYVHEYSSYSNSPSQQEKGSGDEVFSNEINFSAHNIRTENATFIFDYRAKTKEIKDIKLQIPGFHNVENATAAINACILLEVPVELIKSGLETFKGVKRRFEYIIKQDNLVYIDDYAHHPTEIEAFLKSVKALYPNKKLTCIFQPHLYSRTRDFAEGFSKSLSLADQVLLMDIYPARELPIPGVDSAMLFKDIAAPEKTLVSKANLMEKVKELELEIIVTVGAGDIDTFVEPIKNYLTRN
ncbi:MAG: UDP-N-acetylmuramate--L-alanine ligase [Cytophagales bacterium]